MSYQRGCFTVALLFFGCIGFFISCAVITSVSRPRNAIRPSQRRRLMDEQRNQVISDRAREQVRKEQDPKFQRRQEAIALMKCTVERFRAYSLSERMDAAEFVAEVHSVNSRYAQTIERRISNHADPGETVKRAGSAACVGLPRVP